MNEKQTQQPKVKPRIPKDEGVEALMRRFALYQNSLKCDLERLKKESRNKKSYKTELIIEVYKSVIGMLQCIAHIEVLSHVEEKPDD